MTTLVQEVSVQTKLKQVKRRALPQRSPRPMTHIDDNLNAHIIFTPLTNNNKPLKHYTVKSEFADVFEFIRKNFKNYTTKAAHHLNSYYIQPLAEQKLIDKYFADDKKLQQLAQYLDTALKEFEQNALRFMPNVKDTDYKLDISVSERNNTAVSIGFRNAEGKQIGPFLSTHITTSPLDGYDYLSVTIGYKDKHKQPIITRSFDYEVLAEADNMTEKRGDKTYFKTHEQMMHDDFADTTVKKVKDALKHKRDGWEI